MGFDDPSVTAPWVEQEGFQYEIWTDSDRTLAETYGAVSRDSQSFPSRVTMLLNAQGELLLEYTDRIEFGTHPGQVLSDAQALFGPDR